MQVILYQRIAIVKKLLLFWIASGLLLSLPLYAVNTPKKPKIITATLTGQGFLKTQSGDVKTCAGNEVYLEPYTDEKNWTYQKIVYDKYAETIGKNFEIKLAKLYVETGDNSYYKKSQEKPLEVIPIEYDYRTLSDKFVLKTQCDATGNFEFTDLKQGKYIIATEVTWKTDTWQGGYVSKIIDINQTKQKVFLTE